MRIGTLVAGAVVVLGPGMGAGADPVERAGTLGIAYFDGLTPPGEDWFTGGIADVNGDGHADIVAIRSDGQRIGVVASSSNGYEPLVTSELCNCFGSGRPPIATGDIDGDGTPDILVADRAGQRVWAVPFVDGAFGAGWWIDSGGKSPDSFPFEAMPDLDGDGKDDLVFARSGELVAVLSGAPGVAFVRATGTAFLQTLTDITGDGVPDAVDTSDGLVRVFPGGAEGFGAPVEVHVSPGSVSVVDLDGDGAADLIGSDAATEEGWIRRNEGGGTFGTERRFAAATTFSSLVGIGDLDASGLPDVVGSGMIWQDPWLATGLSDRGALPSASRYSARDLNGDGLLDLIAMRAESVTALLNRDDGVPVVGTRTIELLVDPLDVRAADFDDDGVLELVVSDRNGLSVWRRSSDGDYTGETLASGVGARFMSVPADVNGDGATDLVASDPSGAVEVWLGSADGLDAEPVRYEFDEPSWIWQVAVGDVTGDGLPDIAAGDLDAGVVRLLVGNMGGMPTEVETIAMESAKAVAMMDINGDGVAELVVSGGPGYRIRGFRYVATEWQIVADVEMEARPYWLATDDLDNDGWDDLAVGFDFPGGRSVQVLYGGPAGLSAPIDVSSPERGHAEVTIADVNQDGLKDLIVAPWNSFSSGAAGVWLQVQPRSFVDGGRIPGFAAGGVTVADLDGNGAPDIAAVCNNGSIDLLQVHLGRIPPCPADLNSDGTLNFFDVAAFIALFQSGDPAADFNGDTLFNFFDFSAYLTSFNMGCP